MHIGRKTRSLGTFDSEDEAERVLSAAAAQLSSPKAFRVDGETLAEVGRRFLDRREMEGLRNVPTDRSRFKCHVDASWLGEMPIKAITARDVRQWADELAKKETIDRRKPRKVSRATRKHCANLLRGCFELAITEGLLESNPATGLKVRQDGDTGEKWTYLTLDEQHALASCEKIPEADRLRMLFSMYTGLRQREQWCLLLADVRLDDPSGPHVIVRYGAPGLPTKSNKVRRVPLIREAVAVVERSLKLLPAYAPENPLGLVFPTPRGHRRDRGKLYGFHEHRAVAGITRPVRWHDLRHTCASSLVAGWWGKAWRLEEVRELLGHSSVEVTERYAHLASSVIQTAANATRGLGPVQIRSSRDPRGANPAKARPMGRRSGAVGHRFESCGARQRSVPKLIQDRRGRGRTPKVCPRWSAAPVQQTDPFRRLQQASARRLHQPLPRPESVGRTAAGRPQLAGSRA